MLVIFKEIKKPSDSMMDHYRQQFIRNQNKWMRRSKLTPEHLDAEFKLEKKKYQLRGSFDPTQFIIEENGSGKFFMVDSDRVDKAILKNNK